MYLSIYLTVILRLFASHRNLFPLLHKPNLVVIIIIIIIIRQFIRRRNMSVKSLQGRRTTHATRIKLMKLKVQNTTVKTNESWADSWRCRVLVQIECRSADCSTLQDQRRRMPGCQDEVWCEGRRGLHELQSGERRERKLMRSVHISPVCNLVPYHSAPCRLINIVWTWCALSPAASVVYHVRMELHALDGHHRRSLEPQSSEYTSFDIYCDCAPLLRQTASKLDGCLEVRGEIIRTVLCCIVYWSCAQS